MKADRETVDYYNAEADVYDAVRYGSKKGARVDRFHKQVLTDHLLDQVAPDARVIEIGCGTGRLTSHALNSGVSVVGLDVSGGMLRVAHDRLRGGRASLLAGSVDMLPFGDAEFDGGYAILVLNLIPDLSSALAELARVIKPGCIFFFNLPNLFSVYLPGGLYVNLRQKTVTRNQAGYRYSHWYTVGRVEALLRGAGFELEHVEAQPFYFTDAGRGCFSSRVMAKSLYYKARRKV